MGKTRPTVSVGVCHLVDGYVAGVLYALVNKIPGRERSSEKIIGEYAVIGFRWKVDIQVTYISISQEIQLGVVQLKGKNQEGGHFSVQDFLDYSFIVFLIVEDNQIHTAVTELPIDDLKDFEEEMVADIREKEAYNGFRTFVPG